MKKIIFAVALLMALVLMSSLNVRIDVSQNTAQACNDNAC